MDDEMIEPAERQQHALARGRALARELARGNLNPLVDLRVAEGTFRQLTPDDLDHVKQHVRWRLADPGAEVHILFAQTKGTVSVSVRDQGRGIEPADQERIFERFERADSGGAGTGLGLAISRRLARSMGGDIGVESRPGFGSTFTLILPSA